jgi:hypothetical protein
MRQRDADRRRSIIHRHHEWHDLYRKRKQMQHCRLRTFVDAHAENMALRLGVRRDYLAVLVRLSYLSPEIVRAILVGQQPIELTPTRLVALSRNLPHDWQEQWRLIGFAPMVVFQRHKTAA